MADIEDPDCALPGPARDTFLVLIEAIRSLDRQIDGFEREIASRAKQDQDARRLVTIPGVGPIIATAMLALAPPPVSFRCGRDFAAWLGLTPRQRSTGGKERLGHITKAGERTLRRLLIIGAAAVVKHASKHGAPQESWLAGCWHANPACWSSSRSPTRPRAPSGHCLPKAVSTKLRSRPPDGSHEREVVEAQVSKGRHGTTVGQTGPGKPVGFTVQKSTPA